MDEYVLKVVLILNLMQLNRMTKQEIILDGILATMDTFGWKDDSYTIDSIRSHCYQIDNSFNMIRSEIISILKELGFTTSVSKNRYKQRVKLNREVIEQVFKKAGKEIGICDQ